MNFPVHFRAFAVILLAAFTVLVSGCANSPARDVISGVERVNLYEPVGRPQIQLIDAHRICAARISPNIGTIVNPGGALIQELWSEVDILNWRKIPKHGEQAFAVCMTEHGYRILDGMPIPKNINAPIPIPGNTNKFTALHTAVNVNDTFTALMLISSRGANIDAPDKNGATPLHWAAFSGHIESVSLLRVQGAGINSPDNTGATPLHAAASQDKHNIVQFLIKNGAKTSAVTKEDWTPLHTAARHNAAKTAGALISGGANIEAQGGDEGLTPLHRAALHGSVEAADLLIARGANLNAKTYAGEIPLDIAKREGKRDVVALLERATRVATRKAKNAEESGTADGGDNAESVFENAWRSVVVVIAGDSQGGGVVINEPNQVATNCHVVDESPNNIRVYKGENRRAVRDAPLSAEIVSGDRDRDICILSVPGLWAIPAKIRPVAELEIGETVYAVGTPKGLDFSISNGIVSQLRKEEGENVPLIQTSAAISPGSSGGGLFDSEGRLVGLTTWKIREGENLNFAVPVDWALELR